MIRPLIELRRRRVLLNIDVQKDLFLASGRACVRNHRRVLMNIRRINAWSRKKTIPVVNTLLCHINHKDTSYDYCIDGTDGAKSLKYVLRNRCVKYDCDGYMNLKRNIFNEFDQIMLEKRSSDPFCEPRVDRFFSELAADEVMVTGALAEVSVIETVLGLIQRGRKVTLVCDAIGSRNKEGAEMAMKKMVAKGAKVIETRELVGLGHLNSVRVCKCDRCRAMLTKVAV